MGKIKIITNLIRFILPVVVFLVLEALFFVLTIKLFRINRWCVYFFLGYTLFSYSFFVYQILKYDRSSGPSHIFYWAIGAMILHLVPKLITLLFWLVALGVNFLISINVAKDVVSGRRNFIGKLGLGLAAIPFLGIIHGMLKGKYNYKIITKTLFFDDLPEDFDGFKILQISDLHSGSFDDKEKIEHAIDLINDQKADLFLFTGDIVNTKAEEFVPWIDTFKAIKSFSFGKYSVLGNHDYGEYVSWPSESLKQQNFEDIKGLHQKVGFNLLTNQNVTLSKGNASIKLIGVENWGRNFKQAGDLNMASKGVRKEDFKILMSHDPSHWDEEVQYHNNNYHLTLSGHTHGLQFGIEIPGFFKWSPVQYVYKQWAGLYKNLNRYVYVNRGFGFHAFPGRVGIWPEITVLELKRKEV